jgi:hypothetical protein
MKLISIKGIYVATLVYQLYRIQVAPSSPGLAASQAAGRLQARAQHLPRNSAQDRLGHALERAHARLSVAASKARTPATLAPFRQRLKCTSQPAVDVPRRPHSWAEQCSCAARWVGARC